MDTYISEFVMTNAKSSISLSVCQGGWQACGPNHHYGPLTRNYYVIHYIISGKGRYKVNDKTYNLKASDGFLIMPGDNAFYQADGKSPWEYYWVAFYGNEAEHLLNLAGLGRNKLTFSQDQNINIKKHISDIYYASKDYKSREYAMIGFLYLMFSNMIKQQAAKKYNDTYLKQATEFIAANYADHITVEQIAAYIGINRSYLYRIFKESYNTSVKEYIDSYRLSKARDLIAGTSMQITEISTAVGFSDLSHFSKKYRSAFNESPAAYRKSLNQDE